MISLKSIPKTFTENELKGTDFLLITSSYPTIYKDNKLQNCSNCLPFADSFLLIKENVLQTNIYFDIEMR